MSEILPKSDINLLRRRCMEDLYFFAKAVLQFDWLDPDIHLPLCRILEDYENITRAAITLPRGWLKTTLCSQAYPMWRAIRNPNIRVLLVQNTFTNAVSKLKVIKSTFEENKIFRMLFPELLPDAKCTWKGESLCVKRDKAYDESTFEAAGVRTQVTSRHYDIIIEDDTVAPDYNELGEENICPTKDDIDLAIGWHRLAIPLLTNPKSSQLLIVGTRWFEKDLLSWVEENEKSYMIYKRACLETDGRPDPDGEPVYPKRFDRDVLEEIKMACGPYLFSCLYMNSPVNSANMIFSPEWIRYYEVEPQLSDLLVFTTIDPAGDPELTKGRPDYNTIVTTGKNLSTGRIYVLGYFRKKCSPGELIDELFKHVRQWHPVKVGVESVAYQGTLQYWIKERMRTENLYFFVEGFTHGHREKNARIMGLQPLVNSGDLVFRRHMVEMVNELVVFPNGANDDLIDALSSQLRLWHTTLSKREVILKKGGGPFDFEQILNELNDRNKVKKRPPFDTLKEDRELVLN